LTEAARGSARRVREARIVRAAERCIVRRTVNARLACARKINSPNSTAGEVLSITAPAAGAILMAAEDCAEHLKKGVDAPI